MVFINYTSVNACSLVHYSVTMEKFTDGLCMVVVC